MNLNVKAILGTPIAVSAKKGEILFNEIKSSIENGDTTVDFGGISDLTTAFLNVAIGHLYNELSADYLNKHLTIINLDELDKYLLSQVIERVKLNEKKEADLMSLIGEIIDNGNNL